MLHKFSSQFNSNTSFSILLTMVLPVVNVTGAFFARTVNNKLKKEAETSAVFLAIAFCFIYLAKKPTINMKTTKPPHQF